ncbi:hypothetical protein [Spirulina sp. 06S082]|uniref:hypothetical protein n=1 Tax=Spirulina sp. 06S082 TaxID=3110248 RepID=UPI002B1EEDE9|nr:hypothetical protein [Spirulina sp. 06S082]MEA5469342.1 hypothetical protein [Spirulina sp. 06S082]
METTLKSIKEQLSPYNATPELIAAVVRADIKKIFSELMAVKSGRDRGILTRIIKEIIAERIINE